MHMFGSVTFHELKIQQSVEGELHQHHHYVVMLMELSLEALLDREFVGRHRAERGQIAEVPCFRC